MTKAKQASGEILVSGKFAREKIVTHYKNSRLPVPGSLKISIEDKWIQYQKSNPNVFNGPLLRVDRYKIHKNFASPTLIELHLTDTDYKEFVGTRDLKNVNSFGANPISAGAVIVTSDNKLVFGKRSSYVDASKSKISIFAGYLNPEKDVVSPTNDGGQVDLFHGVIREIREESGIQKSNIIELVCMGLIYNTEQNQTLVHFYAKLNISADYFAQIRKEITDTEFSELLFVDNNPPSIKSFEISLGSQFSDVSSPVLELYSSLFHSTSTSG